MSDLSKYIKSGSVEIYRSEINLADYNPRKISDDAKKKLKQGIKKFGLVGGIVVNGQTGNTLVSGHQRLSVMDELNKYPEKDYLLRVDMIDVDTKAEKELNILINNPGAMGDWDYDALREIIPDIDYKSAGLSDEDLNLIGVDFLLQTDDEQSIAGDFEDVMRPVAAQREAEKDAKIAHAKEVKAQVMQESSDKVQDMDAYVIISFDNYKNKSAFMQRFSYNPEDKFIKGEVFSNQIERVD